MNIQPQKNLKSKLDKLKEENRALKERLTSLKKENHFLQKALKENGKLFKEIPGTVLLVQDGKVVLTNGMDLQQLGYSEEEMLHRNFLDLVHPDSVDFVRDLHKKRVSGKPVPDQYDTYLTTKSGESYYCEVRVKKTRYQAKQAFLFNIIGLDQRKQREERLTRAMKMETLGHAALSLNRELNDCLGILDSYASPLMRSGAVPEADLAEFLTRAEALRKKGNAIVQKVGSLARGTRDGSGPVLLDLKKVVQDAVALIRPQWKEEPEGGGRIKVKTYLRTLSPVEGYPEEIQDVLVNMISNAIDALPPDGGEVYLTTEENLGFAHIYIQDNGGGIPNDVKDKIFDPFFSTKGGSHLGLGLSQAYAVITGHGGEIEVMSQEGQGAAFTIKLPLAKRPSPAKVKGSRSRIKNSQILIIADEGMVKDLLSRLFESKGGEVIAVSTDVEGLRFLKKNKIDLVVADANTACFDPIKFVPKLKKTGQTPVALVNVENDDRSLRALKELGADLLIQRPLETDTILSVISKALAMGELSG
jgi:PAS domain S-box-containing protein